MITHILDTGVVSRYLSNVKHFVELLEYSIDIEKCCISVVTKIELLNWLSNKTTDNVRERNALRKGILLFPVIHINLDISKKADAYIEKEVNSKPGDTFIGISAKHHNLILITADKSDFGKFGILQIKVNQ